MQELGAIWKRKSKKGDTYLSGILNMPWGKMKIVCFLNDKKTKDNQPDFRMFLSEDERPRQEDVAGRDDMGFERSRPKKEVLPTVDLDEPSGKDDDEINPEDIPF